MFGRRGKRGRHHAGRDNAPAKAVDAGEQGYQDQAELEPASGPYDAADAPSDGLSRLDLGSVQVPVPDGAQLQVEMEPSGSVRAVHLVTPVGQLTISAYAAPRSGGLWKEISEELGEKLRSDGARVVREAGEWSEELVASANDVALRFVGVDGERWMLRGVVAGPREHAHIAGELLRNVVRETIVVRGPNPMPVSTALPVELPPAIAQHIQQQQAQGGQG
ncbi:DUF3710 domain-containing protein [Kutzneria viridogrisea]|uniref:DUF3710 domain-containing protein n=2 Tax=Kutzneria TaxID=43356 RepID=W5WPW3_9PSEU|nr:DUF3710 domain-containing protein [Kutzneria albida]AHI00200.1 hypothetical protein KALB_6841 [Kutzneria albida DSM 43870]MBA8925376.1 hypothetical protein [Kutzneria viridogrisea]